MNGAEFVIGLPAAPRETAGDSILLVEDSPDVRLILTDLLNGSHYEVVAADGQSGCSRPWPDLSN